MTGVLIGAWLDIRSKPLRTIAAIAGMVAAVVAVVMVDAAGVLSRDANNEYLARQFGMRVTSSIYPPQGASTDIEERFQTALIDNGFTTLSPDVPFTFTIQNEDAFPTVSAEWVSPAYNQIRIVDLVAGAWPAITAESPVPHLVISQALATELGYSGPDAIGQVLFYGPPDIGARFDSKTTPMSVAIIDGVAAGTTNALSSADLLLVSDLPPANLLREGQPLFWLVRTNPADTESLRELVAGFTDENGQPVYTMERADQSSKVSPVLDQQDVTAFAVTVVALTIGGLGILGIGLASVRERGTEFGVRRALGASKRRIFVSVIVQTMLEVLLAAAIAIPLAAIGVELFTRQLVLDALPLPSARSLPVSSAVLGLGGALVVGMIAGLVPAINAARTSVVRALRG